MRACPAGKPLDTLLAQQFSDFWTPGQDVISSESWHAPLLQALLINPHYNLPLLLKSWATEPSMRLLYRTSVLFFTNFQPLMSSLPAKTALDVKESERVDQI